MFHKFFRKKKSVTNQLLKKLIIILILVFFAWIFLGSKLPFARSKQLEDIRQNIIASPPVTQLVKRVNPNHKQVVAEFSNLNQNIDSAETFSSMEAQLQSLADKGKLFSKEANKVLEEVVKPNEDDSSMADRAIKYGQYIYCQQVVKEWESKNQ